MNTCKRLGITAGVLSVAAGGILIPVANAGAARIPRITIQRGGATTSTTVDACGYFVGTQTSALTAKYGVTTTTIGSWTGVDNNYVNTPVNSLGPVKGAFLETTSTYGTGGQDTKGTELFTSLDGTISQTFSYGPDVAGGFNVAVTATGKLSFLTSNTNGACYSGAFPRP